MKTGLLCTYFGVMTIVLVGLISGLSGFILAKTNVLASYDNLLPPFDIKYSNNDVQDTCKNLSFSKTADCLRLELKEFYNYNLSNSHLYWNGGFPRITNWDRIKREGGVCWHYAEWYVMRSRELGFDGKRVVVSYSDKDADHAVALLTDNNDEYCILDQTSLVGCKKTGSFVITQEDVNETE